MPPLDLTESQIVELVGTRHATTGIEFPPAGLQPYHDWLIRSLHQLAESSFGALRVSPSAAAPTSVCVAPGRANVASEVLSVGEVTLDLAVHNNTTALVWLEEIGGGAGGVAAASLADGWPTSAHLKLAEVTLDAGRVVSVLDRRLESVFTA